MRCCVKWMNLTKPSRSSLETLLDLRFIHPVMSFLEIRWYGDGNCPYTIPPGAWYLSFVVLIFVSVGMQANVSIVEIMLAPYSHSTRASGCG